jgi:hypothetical protein
MRIATSDFETDPFEHGVVPKPFCAGYYDGENYWDFWGDDCAARLVDHFRSIEEPTVVYFHNGGKFDFFFFIEDLEQDVKIINGRIVKAQIGKVELRDSYAAIPVPLAAYKKDDVDYSLFTRERRNHHKDYILKYLANDCIYLHELISPFIVEFGDKLTIGAAALNELKKHHDFKTSGEAFDTKFRQFYYGGRCQCFQSGVISYPGKRIKVVDVHSMYPSVMRDEIHPTGVVHDVAREISANTFFIVADGYNKGAFPLRTKTGLDFASDYGRYFITIHEWQAALETGTFLPEKIVKAYDFYEKTRFSTFVNHFYSKRIEAEHVGDKLHKLFYKLILNSAYGKFATDPDNFKDWALTKADESMPAEEGWQIEQFTMNYIFWSKPSDRPQYYNVATAASITGAARAKLLRGIAAAENPLYCDTDSIICTDFHGVMHESELGTWDLEKEGTHIAIAGKKMYALFDDEKCIKMAHKGARLTADEIVSVATGSTVEYANPVPAFKLDGKHQFITRKIRATAKV